MSGAQTVPAPSDAPPDAASSSAPVVRLRGVRKTYGGAVAVAALDLDIVRGEFFTMLGPSGSGKTTTLRMIAGFEFPDRGQIELAGQDVSGLPPNRRDVNTVFQDYALFPHMSVRENVAYGLLARRTPKADALARADAALAQVRLESFGDRRPGQLSGGQRQRVALARAIVNRPQVLLLDEPLGALDLKLRHQMQVELKQLQAQTGITFIYVTHDQEEALTMSDRIAVFNEGRIVQIGTPAEIYEHPANAFIAGFVGTSSLLRDAGRTIMLRPEKLRVLPCGQAGGEPGNTPSPQLGVGEVAVPGCVRASAYLGSFTRLDIELASGPAAGSRVIAAWPHGHAAEAANAPRIGAEVSVIWRTEDEFVLPEEPS